MLFADYRRSVMKIALQLNSPYTSLMAMPISEVFEIAKELKFLTRSRQ